MARRIENDTVLEIRVAEMEWIEFRGNVLFNNFYYHENLLY